MIKSYSIPVPDSPPSSVGETAKKSSCCEVPTYEIETLTFLVLFQDHTFHRKNISLEQHCKVPGIMVAM